MCIILLATGKRKKPKALPPKIIRRFFTLSLKKPSSIRVRHLKNSTINRWYWHPAPCLYAESSCILEQQHIEKGPMQIYQPCITEKSKNLFLSNNATELRVISLRRIRELISLRHTWVNKQRAEYHARFIWKHFALAEHGMDYIFLRNIFYTF